MSARVARARDGGEEHRTSAPARPASPGFPGTRSACGGGVPHDELLVTRVAAGVLGLDPRAAEATGRTEVDT